MSLKETLERYSKSNMYPFHMPGHKRNIDGSYKIDMTEVDGVDDLHDPESVIMEDQKRMARIFGAKESYFLVGGSTVGNLAAIYAACSEGDTVIIQRNSHKSVFNAVMLRHLKVEYIWPRLDEIGIYYPISLEEIKEAVKKSKNPKAVVITSPTYEGYHCKIDEIAEYCHNNGIILIVDQAHGAHLGFHEEFKYSAVKNADIIVQSLHKTLPSLTQTAALHVNGDRVDRNRIREALDIFETSSPSYVLMESISSCLDILEDSGDLFREYVDNLHDFYTNCGKLKNIKVIQKSSEEKDPGKLILSTKNTNLTGVELAKILRKKYELETELSSFSYVLAMTSFFDSKEGFLRLEKALKEIDESVEDGQINVPKINIVPNKKMELSEAKSGKENRIKIEDACHMISSSMVCIYPPGAPIIVPGEEISDDVIELIKSAKEKGLHVTGTNEGCISVVSVVN